MFRPPRCEEGWMLVTGHRSLYHRTLFILLSLGCLTLSTCGAKQRPVPAEQTSGLEASATPEASRSVGRDNDSAIGGPGQRTLSLPASFGRRTGDLDEML